MARMVGIEQGSPQWLVARVGCVTASRLWDVTKKLQTKTDEAAVRKAYRKDKFMECLKGRAKETPPNEAMIWGITHQPMAKTEYELRNDVFVEPGGLWKRDTIHKFRASPDYLVGDKGLLEIKCPFNSDNHMETYMSHEVPEKALWQIVGQLRITGRQWCDFVSFDPTLPEEKMQYVQIRVDRDQELVRDYMQAADLEVTQFLLEIEQALKFLGVKSRAPADQPEPIFPLSQKAVAV